MIFITGGRSQGKREFVRRRFDVPEEKIYDPAGCPQKENLQEGSGAGDETARPDDWMRFCAGAGCIGNYQELIRQLLDVGADPETFTRRLMDENPDLILIMDEVGCGIVPIERKERRWREACGQCGCLIAARAQIVIRLVCGIPMTLKDES